MFHGVALQGMHPPPQSISPISQRSATSQPVAGYARPADICQQETPKYAILVLIRILVTDALLGRLINHARFTCDAQYP